MAAIAAIAAIVLAIPLVSAASGKPAAHGKGGRAVTLKCTAAIATQPPAGSATVDQPPANGDQYGRLHCPEKGFGGGVFADSFTTADSGDMVGRYTEYLGAGSISGRFDLAPQEGQGLSSSNFASQSWTGTVTVTGGTGVYRNVKSKAHPGTLSCTSADTVHLTCSEKIGLTGLAG